MKDSSKLLGMHIVRSELPATEQTDVNAILQQAQSAADGLSQDAFDQRVAEARAELAGLTREAEMLEAEVVASKREFEENPSSKTHSAMVVAEQLARNAIARRDQRSNDHAPLLSAAAVKDRQQRLNELRKKPVEWRARFDARSEVVVRLIQEFEAKLDQTLSEHVRDLRELNIAHQQLDALEASLGNTENRWNPVSVQHTIQALSAALQKRLGSPSAHVFGPHSTIHLEANGAPNHLVVLRIVFEPTEALR